MIKFLIGVFFFLFVIPSMIFSIWAYFEQKKEAKNPKGQPRPQNLSATSPAQAPLILPRIYATP